jgi:hypothetical protein
MMNGDYQGLAGLMKLKGRMGDTQLVHMSPMEVKTLDAMAPGGLTRNPSTGLPEAFKLKDLLPALGAVAGGVFLAPLLGTGALAAGAGTGLGAAGGTALAGGNKEEILTSGLMSGVTAGIMAPGADKAAAGLGTAPIGQGAQQVAGKTGSQFATEMLGRGPTALQQTMGGLDKLATQPFGAALSGATPAVTQTGSQMVQQALAAPTGIKALAQKGIEQVGSKGLLASGAMGLATSPGFYDVPAQPEVEMFPEVTSITKTPTGVTKEDIDRYIRQGGSMPRFFDYKTTYAAEGGDIGGGEMFSGLVPNQGQGDGMSDDVSFEVVGDPEIKRAMLSPDEYVLSAHDVALLGNGSTVAGATKLDEFRKALREKGYGRKSLPNQINANKELNKLS